MILKSIILACSFGNEVTPESTALPSNGGPTQPGGLETAVMASVGDGDTIGLTDGRKVRYMGINSPRRHWNSRSKSRASVVAIYGLTEGNPLFSEEICTSLIASRDIYYTDSQWRWEPLSQIDIPDSGQGLIRQRLIKMALISETCPFFLFYPDYLA